MNLLVFHNELTAGRRRNNPEVEFVHRNRFKKFEGREGKEGQEGSVNDLNLLETSFIGKAFQQQGLTLESTA